MVILTPAVLAADSTPSADIKAKLEELKKEIASKAAKLKQEVNRKLQNKAYVGKVKSKTTTSLTLATRTGPKIVSLNQDTISPKKLAEEDDIAALGDIDDNGVLTAKKIVLLPTTNLPPKTQFWGQIIAISDGLITIKGRDAKNVAVSVAQAEVKGDLKINNFIILTGTFNKNDIFEASFIYVIPQGGILKPKKIATPSASLRASPSAQTSTPSAKPKSTR